MGRYLIEVAHEADKEACNRAIKTLLSIGSHYLTNSDWGCTDGEHKSWMIVDIDSKEDALLIVPPEYRNDTRVISLEKFTLDEDGAILSVYHP